MKNSDDYRPNLSFGLLLKGPPKSGKTTLSLMFPNPYILDCDNNLGGAVRLFREKFGNKEFRYDTPNVGEDGKPTEPAKRWPLAVEMLKAAAKDEWVKTLIVDTAGSLTTYLTDYIVAEKANSNDKEKDKMTIKDWIPFRNMLTKFITTFRSCNKFFIMTAHEIVVQDEDSGGIIGIKPAIPSNLKDHLGGFFSDEWLCCAEEQKGIITRYVKTVPEPKRSMGASLDLPPTFEFKWDAFAERMAKFNEVMKKGTK
jgi:hypothetical protein